MIDQDYSFIRLRNDFDEAKNLSESPEVREFFYGQVQLCTNETYLQITNTSEGISFQSNYIASIVNCGNEVLETITDKVFIYEFSDYKGIQQIAFEIRNIAIDFEMEDVYLRIESATNSEYVYWSNPMHITDIDVEYTSYLSYRNDSIWEGTDYVTTPYFQRIRLATYFMQNRNADEVDIYRQMTTGNSVNTRVLFNRFREYNLEKFDGWSLERLRVALTCSDVYLDSIRCFKQGSIEDTDRVEVSNMINTNFLVGFDQNDTQIAEDQIYGTLELLITSLVPAQLSYPLGGLPAIAECTFNQDVILQTGSIRLYDSTDTLLHTFTEADLSISSNNKLVSTGDLNTYATGTGLHHILMDADLIQSAIGEDFEGITSSSVWNFNIF